MVFQVGFHWTTKTRYKGCKKEGRKPLFLYAQKHTRFYRQLNYTIKVFCFLIVRMHEISAYGHCSLKN